jgi:hypothetical protein
MSFKKWLEQEDANIDLYNCPEEAMEMAWDAALKQAEQVVADRYDEQEPWLEPGEITKVVNGI